jgi:hypothetical protein
MTKLPDGSIAMGLSLIPVRGSDTEMEFLRMKIINISSSGEVLREYVVSEECGVPESIAADGNGSLVISSRVGNGFFRMKFFIVKIFW